MNVVLTSRNPNLVSQIEVSIPLSLERPQEIPREWVKYNDKDFLGNGYFANVYKGTVKNVQGETWEVAIKILNKCDMKSSKTEEARSERVRKRATREFQTGAALSHRNILPMIGVCYGENPMIITPYCKSGNLHTFMESNSGITAPQRLGLLLGAARGLEHLHTFTPQICHGDVKPSNFLVDDNGTDVFLCDFGLAKGFEAIDTVNATSGLPNGTVRFASPEQLHQAQATAPGDVFSFGCLILNVITGMIPWRDQKKDNAVNSLRIREHDATPDLSDYPSLTQNDSDLMTKCWAYEPANRPLMKEVIDALKENLEQRSVE